MTLTITTRRCSLAAVAVIISVLAAPAAAQVENLISVADCYVINPNPEFVSCAQLTEPYQDVFSSLPWATNADYEKCVRKRCVCNGQRTELTGWPINGMQCSTAGWNESGLVTCNTMSNCYKWFFDCVQDAIMDRHNAGLPLDPAELTAVNDMIGHGQTPGQDFEVTNIFRSCRMIMCEAAASRLNCGLLTCLPNNTQCYEYIKPPPLPDIHQLCTQGCRAVLVMMAMTIVVFFSAIACCACCPARVIVNEPLLMSNSDEDEEGAEGKPKKKEKETRRRDSDRPDSDFDVKTSSSKKSAEKKNGNDKE